MLSTIMTQDQEFLEFSGRNRYVNLPNDFGLKFKIIMPKGSGKKTQLILQSVNSPTSSKLFFESNQKLALDSILVLDIIDSSGHSNLAIGRITYVDIDGYGISISVRDNEKVIDWTRLVAATNWIEVQKSAQDIDAKTVAPPTNKSLFSRKYGCCFHINNTNFDWYALRGKTQYAEPNHFGVSVYKNALSGKDPCNYNLLQVRVCPECLFASISDKDFNAPDNKRIKDFEYEKRQIRSVNDGFDRRKKIFEKADDTLFTEERSYESALVSYDLAIESLDSLIDATVSTRQAPLQIKKGNLFLLKSQLYDEIEEVDASIAHLEKALKVFRSTFENLEMPETVIIASKIVSLTVYLGKDDEAKPYLKVLDDIRRSKKSDEHSQAIAKYYKRARDFWDDRDFKRNPNYKQNEE